MGSIPGLERSPGEGNGSLLQYSCLGNPMDRRAWQATVQGVAKESNLIWQLNNDNIPLYNVLHFVYPFICQTFPGGSDGKVCAYNAGDLG